MYVSVIFTYLSVHFTILLWTSVGRNSDKAVGTCVSRRYSSVNCKDVFLDSSCLEWVMTRYSTVNTVLEIAE